MNKLVLIAIVSLFAVAVADNYAVLVAGSMGFGNYRHQSDVCHAYHTLLSKGYKASHIIVMSYNDVAKNRQNPFKNQLFNKPSYDKPGVDVNKGCVIDYQGKDVTPENYLAIIQGQKDKVKGGNKRVLESGADDHVFLAFFDHGAPGLIAFPSEYLYATDLQNAFQYMFKNQIYGRLVYYMEACESGSMFQDMPNNLNIYALSAANPNESSWAAYCGSDAVVHKKNIGSCLGDLFSVSWMEDTDNHKDLSNYSLEQQFVVVANLTSQSQVMQWGDLTFTSEAIGDYLSGKTSSKSISTFKKIKNYIKSYFKFEKDIISNEPKKGLLDSRQATIHYLLNKYTSNPTTENYEELNFALQQSDKFQRTFEKISKDFSLSGVYNGITTNFDCYKQIVNEFQGVCGKIPEDQLGQLKYFYEFCGKQFQNVSLSAYFQNVC